MAFAPQYDAPDPFDGATKTPALSWRNVPVGSVFTLEILEAAKTLQCRNYDTSLPDFWDEAKTQPKMAAVLNVEVKTGPHSVGERRSVWANIPSDLFVAIGAAQKQAGAKIAAGGTLSLKFVGETPHKLPRMNPIKNYLAKYVPPVAPTAGFYEPHIAAYTVTRAGAAPQAAPPAGWPGAARPAQQAQGAQATMTVCQYPRLDPVTGQPAGICGEPATAVRGGQYVCPAHPAPAHVPPVPREGMGTDIPF